MTATRAKGRCPEPDRRAEIPAVTAGVRWAVGGVRRRDVDQCLHLNDVTEVNPQKTSVAFLVNFGAVTLTAADESLCVLGTGR